MSTPAELQGRRVLLVEDELLVSMLVEDILLDLGCEIVGPAARLEEALEAARTEAIDIALLDVNLAGMRSFPVADVLAARGIPFVFCSGYGEEAILEPHQGRPVVQKPFSPDTIGDVLLNTLQPD